MMMNVSLDTTNINAIISQPPTLGYGNISTVTGLHVM